MPSRDGTPPAKLAGSPRVFDGNPGRVPKPSRDGALPGNGLLPGVLLGCPTILLIYLP